MITRLVLSVTVMMAVAVSIVSGATKQLEIDRTDRQICEEVRHELNIQAQIGLISQEEANKISDRCFKTFTNVTP